MKLKKPKTLNYRLSLFFTLCVIATSGTAVAAPIVWSGLGDATTYEDDENWVGSVAPANDLTTDVATFTEPTVDLLETRQVSGLDYSLGSIFTGDGSIEIGTAGIVVSGDSVLSISSVVFNQADTLISLTGGQLSATGLISGTGALTVTGGNQLLLENNGNTFSGGLTINPGATVLASGSNSIGTGNIVLAGGSLGSNGNVDLGDDRTITLSGGGTLFATTGRIGSTSNDISGTGPLTIGPGGADVFLDAENSFTGGININGTVAVSNANRLGVLTDPVAFDGGTLRTNGGRIIFDNDFPRTITLNEGGGTLATTNQFISVQIPVDGPGQLTITGNAEPVFLDTENTYEGGTVITGIASVRTGAAFGGTFSEEAEPIFEEDTPILLDGGEISANASIALNEMREITLSADGGTLRVSSNNRFISLVSSITGEGQLTIAGGPNNSNVFIDSEQLYTGGTLLLGAFARPMADNGFGAVTGAVTLDGGRIFPNADNVTFDAARSFILGDAGGELRPFVSNDTPDGVTTYPSVFSGTGDLTIAGTGGRLVLSGENTYTGSTIVNGAAGDATGAVLAINGSSLSDFGTLVINNDSDGAAADEDITTSGQVEVTGTEQVSSLILNGVTQDPGTYGSSASSADFTDDVLFSTAGTGIISVVPAVLPTGFADFIAGTFANGTVPVDQQGPNDDPDNDGIDNLLEFAIAGQDPTVANPNIGTFENDLLSFTQNPAAVAAGITYIIEQSTDLGVTDPFTEVSGDGFTNDGTTISFQLTPGDPERNFARLRVSE